MEGYKIIGFNIVDFKGIELVNYDWKGNEGLVVVGDHGEGKSNVIEALNVLLEGAKALKKIDNPVHDGAKKYKIEAVFKGDGTALACYDVGSLFRITATQSTTGSQQLKIENLDESGKPIKASVRDILKTLRGLYVDPHQLMTELEGYNGDRDIADRVLKNIGLDLSEFDNEEERLSARWSADNQEVDRNRKVLESIEIPVEGFPTEKIDTEKLWNESTSYKEFKERNQGSDTQKAVLESELKNAKEALETADNDLFRSKIEVEEKQGTVELVQKNSDSIKNSCIEDLKKILNEVNSYELKTQVVVEKINFSNSEISELRLKYDSAKESLRLATIIKIELEPKIENLELKINEVKEKIKASKEPEKWKGLQDQTGELTPDQFITKSIQDATTSNALFSKKEEYQKAELNLKASEISRDNTGKLRKINVGNRTKAVAGADFQVNGLSVNDKGVLTAKIDGRPVVTLKDLNHADTLRVLSEILMVNNTAPLKLIVIKEGYACKPEYQKIIFDMARKHGHTAIMESFVSLEDEGCLYMKDGISSDTPPVDLEVFESDENVQDSTNKSGPDWGN